MRLNRLLLPKSGIFLTFLLVLGGCGSDFGNDLVSLTSPSGVDDPVVSDSVVTTNTTNGNDLKCELTEGQQAMLDLVNNARAVARSCGSTLFPVAEPLVWNCELMSAAVTHSKDMASNNFFSHTGSNGLQVSDRVTGTGYDWQTVGENIAAGYPSEADTVAALLESPGHCVNIMNPDFKELGSAVEFTNRRVYPSYWTQVFAAQFQ